MTALFELAWALLKWTAKRLTPWAKKKAGEPTEEQRDRERKATKVVVDQRTREADARGDPDDQSRWSRLWRSAKAPDRKTPESDG